MVQMNVNRHVIMATGLHGSVNSQYIERDKEFRDEADRREGPGGEQRMVCSFANYKFYYENYYF